jgi:hypothetical protein
MGTSKQALKLEGAPTFVVWQPSNRERSIVLATAATLVKKFRHRIQILPPETDMGIDSDACSSISKTGIINGAIYESRGRNPPK